LIPDGVAHSTSYKKITDFTESDGKVIFNITNNGNVEALPIVTAKMNSDNGYFGLVNPSGVMEVGDREIIDSETRKFSERPFDYTDTGTGIKDGLAKGQKNMAIL
ncbi:phage tail protein, partial [Listeria monocytogenes]|uniref:phage tail domain-containing protein n=1 Tax=Listeria monocytogenes TaxID=1639 RepID=UPI000D9828C1